MDIAKSAKQNRPVWVDAELYLTGTISWPKPNSTFILHTHDYDFGQLVISLDKTQKEILLKKSLHGQNTIHVRIKQDFHTGHYDPTTASLLAVLEPPLSVESDDAYIERLIQQADPAWKDVEDPEAWLREIRGYDD